MKLGLSQWVKSVAYKCSLVSSFCIMMLEACFNKTRTLAAGKFIETITLAADTGYDKLIPVSCTNGGSCVVHVDCKTFCR